MKPGAVDIVRHWQELGYIIIYVTGRPDMQLQRVVSWLAQVHPYTFDNRQTAQRHSLPVLFWLSSYVASHHLAVAIQSGAKD